MRLFRTVRRLKGVGASRWRSWEQSMRFFLTFHRLKNHMCPLVGLVSRDAGGMAPPPPHGVAGGMAPHGVASGGMEPHGVSEPGDPIGLLHADPDPDVHDDDSADATWR